MLTFFSSFSFVDWLRQWSYDNNGFFISVAVLKSRHTEYTFHTDLRIRTYQRLINAFISFSVTSPFSFLYKFPPFLCKVLPFFLSFWFHTNKWWRLTFSRCLWKGSIRFCNVFPTWKGGGEKTKYHFSYWSEAWPLNKRSWCYREGLTSVVKELYSC